MYVYIRSESELWTVGFYAPGGKWHADSDHDSEKAAASRVHYLNGGVDDNTIIIGKVFFVEAPDYEGYALVLSVNDDDTVNVQDDYTSKIHIVRKEDLGEEFERTPVPVKLEYADYSSPVDFEKRGIMDINEAIAHLAACRSDKETFDKEIKQIQAEIDASDLGWRLQEARGVFKKINEDIAIAEQEVRHISLASYTATGDKAPHPAIKIKIYTTLDYDPGEALDYARQHLPKALKLDKRAFDKAARGIEPDFVTVAQKPRATIARDLSKYLEETNDDSESA